MHTSGDSKRIAKNTLLLYGRMALIILISLYTSRVILQTLGVTDYGIYNVVGGVVVMVGFISGSLDGATSRYITFELGLKEKGNPLHIFRCAITIHYILAAIVLLVAETVGLWFVIEKLVIPPTRLTAALWVYQCSILTVVISIISSPYNALIIAHEKMGVFAYISIMEAALKLAIVYLLLAVNIDRLILYAVLLLAVQVGIRFIYSTYCNRSFPEASGRWLWDKRKSREIFNYAGWTLNGSLAVMGYTQGLNILLNLFFGPAVNAARGISAQVQSAVSIFCSNFLTAVRPQVTKSYAQGDLDYMHRLIIYGSKYGFFLILLTAVPILININYILHLWLGEVPAHTATFTSIMILVGMNNALRTPTLMGIHATGDIKKFQIIESSLLLTVVPVAYAFLKWGHVSPETVFFIYLIIEIITQFARVWVVYPRINMPKRAYLTKILLPLSKVCIPLLAFGYIVYTYKPTQSFVELLINIPACILFTLLCEYTLGMGKKERELANSKIKAVIQKMHWHRL